jgi:hypothetical protein
VHTRGEFVGRSSDTYVKEHVYNPNANSADNGYTYSPVVKNWYCRKAFVSNSNRFFTGELLDSGSSPDAWVCYNTSASIRFSFSTELQNHDTPTLIFNANAYFEPAGYKGMGADAINLPQFLEPYQDIVGMSIVPTESKDITLAGGYKGSLHSSANENKETESTISSGGISGKIGISHPAKIELKGEHAVTETTKSFVDFELLSRASNTSTIYTAMQKACHYQGQQRFYNVATPDDSMHSYGHFPDYFYSPPSLAKGGLSISSTQEYKLKKGKGELDFEITVIFNQRMIGGSLWQLCANYGYIIEANAKVEITIEKGLVTKVGLFNVLANTSLTRQRVVMGTETILETVKHDYAYNKPTPKTLTR